MLEDDDGKDGVGVEQRGGSSENISPVLTWTARSRRPTVGTVQAKFSTQRSMRVEDKSKTAYLGQGNQDRSRHYPSSPAVLDYCRTGSAVETAGD